MSDEIPSNDVNLEAPVQETTVEAPKPAEFDGLSNRAALEESLKIHREGKDIAEVKGAATATPTEKQVTQAVQADIDPPAEFSAAGKEAWRSKNISGIQKEYKRIHDARTAEISRAQEAERKAREEGKTWRELGEMAKPYIEARGSEGVTPQQAMMEALSLINEFKKGDPATVKAELKKIGIDLDKASDQPTVKDPRLDDLQKTVESLRQEREDERFRQTVQTYESVFDKLTSEKTRSGELVFPDLVNNTKEGLQFAKELGSLTQDPKFQQGVLRRFPNADLVVVVREAYKYLGGKVSGEPVRVSPQSNQQHIEKSRRASAAVPGRTAPRVNDSNLRGQLSNRAALAKALEMHRG